MKGSFKNNFVSARNFFESKKCKLTWMIEEDETYIGSDELTSEQLVRIRNQQRAALSSSEGYFIDDEDQNEEMYAFAVECASGHEVSNNGLYCGRYITK